MRGGFPFARIEAPADGIVFERMVDRGARLAMRRFCLDLGGHDIGRPVALVPRDAGRRQLRDRLREPVRIERRAERDLDRAAPAEDAPALQRRAAVGKKVESPLRAARAAVVARSGPPVSSRPAAAPRASPSRGCQPMPYRPTGSGPAATRHAG